MDLNSNIHETGIKDKLSTRQRQCLQLVETGMTSKEVGRKLAISPSTVDNHIQSACDRLGAKNRTDAIRLYREAAIPLGKQSGDEARLMAEPRAEASNQSPNISLTRFLFSLPPLGGRKNDLSKDHRVFHIVQISMIAIAMMTAGVLTIAGLVHVLSSPR